MKLHARVSRSLVELVKRFEGLRRGAARLPDGGWTIGYGHTRSAREGVVVSPEDAEALLYYDLSEVAQKVDAWTFTPLNQNQFEALTAFAFNIGPENFRRSTVLKRVNEGQHLQAAAALELWRKADFGGENLLIDALVRRRAAEKAHYLTPPEGFRPSPTPVIRPTFDHSVIEAAALARVGCPAAIVNAPLEGEEAEVHLEDESAPGLTDAAFPAVALAASAETGRLHQLSPEEAKTAEPSAADPFVQPETLPKLAETETWPKAFVTVPAGAAPIIESPVETDRSAPLFDAPVLPSERDQTPRSAGHPRDRAVDDLNAARLVEASPRSPRDWSIVYLSIGLLGVALFLAALFSMLGGKATPANLFVGLLGILLMTPAGGYFLLRLLNRGRAAPEP